MQKFKSRLVLIISMIIVSFYFTSDFSLIDIEKTAIIVAISIDKEQENYSVTAQIAIPQATDQTSANNDATVTGKGTTVFSAIDDIGTKTGWHPKLSFCDLILLGDSVLQDDVLPIIDSLIKSTKFPNSALVAACEGDAKELLLSQTPLDAISSFALLKILVKNPFKANNICNLDLKTFAVLGKSASAYGFMPYVKKVEEKEESKEGGSSAGMASAQPVSGGSNAGSAEQGQDSSQNKSVVFDATETAIFKQGKKVGTLDKDQSLIYNMLYKNVHETFISVEDDGEQHLLSVTKSSNSIKVTFNEKPTVLVSLNMKVSETDDSGKHLTDKNIQELVSQTRLDACSEKVDAIIKSIFELSQQYDCDLFQAKTIIYKYHNDYYGGIKDLPLSNFNIKTSVVTKSLD